MIDHVGTFEPKVARQFVRGLGLKAKAKARQLRGAGAAGAEIAAGLPAATGGRESCACDAVGYTARGLTHAHGAWSASLRKLGL